MLYNDMRGHEQPTAGSLEINKMNLNYGLKMSNNNTNMQS